MLKSPIFTTFLRSRPSDILATVSTLQTRARQFATRTRLAMDSPTQQDAKRVKTNPRVIGTHSGAFHADEALAVYLLRLTPEYASSPVVRSRDSETLEKCDIIVDVQGVYDGTKHFDHHQRGFTEVFSSEFKTKLSSAGLIYKHFGPQIIAQRLSVAEDHPSTRLLYKKLYEEYIEAIDANDNGIEAYPKDAPEALYSYRGLSITSMVAGLNPWWNEKKTNEEVDQQFQKASTLMGDYFLQKLDFYGKSWLPARDFVVEALAGAKELDSEGRIIKFDEGLPWKEHLFNLEEEQGVVGQVIYVLYSDGKAWRIQAVPESRDSFASRKALPEVWRGVRDEALSEVSGIAGGVFVHASGFIGAMSTYDQALALAQKALTM